MAPVDPISPALEAIRHECIVAAAGGTLADYIPELSRADPELFGIALGSLSGDVYCAGDAQVPFTIQSVSKPFVLALALEDLGAAAVFERVGAEPSGEPFNAISLQPGTGRPDNPLVNAGAILTTSLVRAGDAAERFERIAARLSEFAGHALAFDDAVFESERATGDRNRAIGYLMRGAGSLRLGVEEVLDVYFRQCSLLVTAHDLALMAATLACGGRNPRTGRQVVGEDTAQHVLSIMTMCGMYDSAGAWMLRVGLPAKSGVSGGLLAVSPGEFGIGLFSPPLDAQGNTVRGVLACERLAERFGLHLLHDPAEGARAAKVVEPAERPRSSRQRRRAERAVLELAGDAIAVLTLRGEVDFAAAELVLLTAQRSAPGWIVLDMLDVTRLHPVAEGLVGTLATELGERGTTVVVVSRDDAPAAVFPTLPEALEWCEDALLAAHAGLLGSGAVVPLEEHDLLAGLDADVREAVVAALVPRRLAVGETLFGDEADSLFAVQSGRVASFGGTPEVRGVSIGAGGTVSRLGGGGPRELRAEVPTTGAVLSRAALDGLLRDQPEAVAALWRSLVDWLTG